MKNARIILVVGGIALMILGLMIVIRPVSFTGWISTVAGIILLVAGILRWLDTRKQGAQRSIGEHPLIISLLGLILMINPVLPIRLIAVALGIWAIWSGISSLISAWRLGKLGINWQEMTVRGLLLLVLGALLLVEPAIISLAIGLPVGLLLIVLGGLLVSQRV